MHSIAFECLYYGKIIYFLRFKCSSGLLLACLYPRAAAREAMYGSTVFSRFVPLHCKTEEEEEEFKEGEKSHKPSARAPLHL